MAEREKTVFASEMLKAKLTFTEQLLGTASNDPEVYGSYIASKAPDAKSKKEEIEAVGVEEVIEKGMTVFPRDEEGRPYLYDYQIKGFFKDACGALREIKGTTSSKIKAYKKKIDGNLFVYPRKIYLDMPAPMGNCQRPLRASTAQGERVALANSEAAPAGTTITFTIECMIPDMLDLAYECLDYGTRRGIGQWRNSGAGRFEWEEIK